MKIIPAWLIEWKRKLEEERKRAEERPVLYIEPPSYMPEIMQEEKKDDYEPIVIPLR